MLTGFSSLFGGWLMPALWLPNETVSLVLLGFLAGFVVGLTSMGSGAIVTPILILLLRVPPSVAVSSSIVAGAVTKGFGSFVHHQRNAVDTAVVRDLLVGSIPGVALASAFFYWLRGAHPGAAADIWIERLLGVALLLLSLGVLLRDHPRLRRLKISGQDVNRRRYARFIGLFIGLLFGTTSIGTGGLLVVLLSMFLRVAEARVVGTAMLYGFITSLFSALFNILAGNVNWALVLPLSLGSIPGAILGSELAVRVHGRVLRICFSLGAAITAWKLL